MVPQVYRYFMTGDDAKCEEADGEQAGEFEARAAGIRQDTERLQAVGGRWRCGLAAMGCGCGAALVWRWVGQASQAA